ncbi:MBL fold metallo-hydrolase [Planococcus beigongshangi]|uniref:MBL fold metallo-hydrolase n=1 Tax=Planococcus beigongshangi TaxID=2782536 RepID=UPI00193AED18|nr:MBL fold metallo-hydrolase [Planococcus beigongshangi]
MVFKKQMQAGEQDGVSWLNGQVKFQRISLNVYSYLVDGVLIDTGGASLHKQFKPFIDEADFDQVMITHSHEDHSGNAAYIEQTKNVPIYLSEKSVDACAQKADYPLYRKLFWGKREPFTAKPMPEMFSSRNAEWDVIDTPGHAHDHKAFLNRETGQLFTGDLFVNPRTKIILAEEDIPSIIQSLDRVLSYDFGVLYCNHAGIIQEGRTALEQKREYLNSVRSEVLDLHKKGLPAEEIRKRLFPKQYPLIKISGREWDSLHIVNSIVNGENRALELKTKKIIGG